MLTVQLRVISLVYVVCLRLRSTFGILYDLSVYCKDHGYKNSLILVSKLCIEVKETESLISL